MAFFSGNKKTTDTDESSKNVFHFELVKKNVLVTGGNGQLGSELKKAVNGKDTELFSFFFTDVDALDITNLEAVEAFIVEHKIQYIINCAAYTAVDKAEDDIDLCYKINRDAVENLAKAAHKYSAKIIHISTDYVFDGTKTTSYVETDAVCPKSVYGTSKVGGEKVLFEYCSQSLVIRTAWLYSVYGNNFVKTMMRLGRERTELNVVADQTGTPTNARDLAEAIVHILDLSERNGFVPGIYHYSNMGVTNWYEFTLAIHRHAGINNCDVKPITTEQYPTRASRPQYSVLDKSKIISTFKLQIPEWEVSLTKCVKELEDLNL